MRATLLAHEVSAIRIDAIQPVRRGDQLLAPDAGVVLILDDRARTKHRWLSEDGVMPVPGNILIKDDITKSSFVVTAEQFTQLFSVTD